MALNVGVNSWVTLIEAEAYFDTRWGEEAVNWLAQSDGEKEKTLVTAFNWLMTDPNYSLTATDTSQLLKNAQCEAALFLFESYTEYRRRENIIASGITEFQYGKNWKEKLSKITKPPAVTDFLDKGGYTQKHIIYNLSDNN